MKLLPLIISGACLTLLYACKKDLGGANSNSTKALLINSSTISGKWYIVTDSSYTGVGLNNHPVDYAGKAGDYYNFLTNGQVYTKEGNVLDTLTYSLTVGDGINMQGFGAIVNGSPSISHIRTLTAHSMIIESPKFLTPGGVFYKKVTLSR